jgi:hypothetical protein
MLSATTYCANNKNTKINAIQKQIANSIPGVFLLGDTDKFSELKYRYDNCHLSESGVNAVVSDFIKSFNKMK